MPLLELLESPIVDLPGVAGRRRQGEYHLL